MSLAMHLLWLALPATVFILILKYEMDPNDFVLSHKTHIPPAAISAFVLISLLYVLLRLALAWISLRHARWTIAQRRLVWLRGLVVALLAAEAALTVLPNVAVVLQPCLYRDGRDSVVRWASVARQGLAFAFVAAKCTEVRCLLLRDPGDRFRDAIGVFRHCLPRAAAASITRSLRNRSARLPGADPLRTAECPSADAGMVHMHVHAGADATKPSPEMHVPPPAAGVAADADGEADIAGKEGDAVEADAGKGGRSGGCGAAEVWPYGQKIMPVLALPEPLLLWAWHVWLLAAGGIGAMVVHGLVRAQAVKFESGGSVCDGSGCQCDRGTVLCKAPGIATAGAVIVATALYAALGCLLLGDLWRARRRVARQLYMANRHTHALLTITQRFSVAAVLIVLLTAGAAVLPATRGDIRSVLPGDGMRRLQTPQRCAAFVSSAFGNPLTNAVLAALAAVELALVWPLLAAEAKRPMHEHLQRFVWVDADLAEAKAARDRGALPHDTSQVPMFSMQRAVNLFFWMNLAYKLSDAPHLRGSIDPAVAAALNHSHRPAMALFGLTRLRFFWEHRSDAKATVAWGRSAIVIAWRGTSTVTNAKMDLHVSRTPLPGAHTAAPSMMSVIGDALSPCGALAMLRRSVPLSQPLVHSGFWNTYRSSGVAERLLMHVFSLLEAGEVDREACTVYVCGHSLGGALAVLNSLDIAAGCGLRREQVVVYTIGCPRVGDRAFARHADAAVPDTWHIINGRDVVTQWGKLGGLYKSSGQRVVLSSAAQLIVRPSFFEYAVHRGGGRSHISEHRPGKYLERLALAIAHLQHLCGDGREAGRISRLLGPPPAAPLPVHGSPAQHAAGEGAAAEPKLTSHRAWRVTSGRGGEAPSAAQTAQSATEAEDGGGLSDWSSLGDSGEVQAAAVAPVVIGDVIRALCAARKGGCVRNRAAAATLAAAAPPACAAAADVDGAGQAADAAGADSATGEHSTLPHVFINIHSPGAPLGSADARVVGPSTSSDLPRHDPGPEDADGAPSSSGAGAAAAATPHARALDRGHRSTARSSAARTTHASAEAAGVGGGGAEAAVRLGVVGAGGMGGDYRASAAPTAAPPVHSGAAAAGGAEAGRAFSAVALHMLGHRR